MAFSPETTALLREKIDAATADPETSIPGLTFVVVGRDGKDKFAYSAGKRGYGASEPMTLDNIFWIASCTKMIVGIACLQLVEKGVLALDDVELVERLAPELRDVKVLRDDGTLEEKKRGITLRMLLTHTAGFGYTFFNEKLRDYSKPVGYDELSGDFPDILQPLVHQPGEGWEYGVSIDWAGILLERATGQSLNDYMHKNIFEPLGLKNISMFPNEDMKKNLAYMNRRAPDGQLSPSDHLFRRPLIVNTADEVKNSFNSGGAGCFAKPQEYCKILATLLNDGESPTTGARILQKSTVDTMFTNQIPDKPDFARRPTPDAKPDLTNPFPVLYPGDGPQGWGLSFMTCGGATGRSEGTAWWAGIANLFWWCDREKGVAGMICTQILPFADLRVMGLWMDLESTIYKALA